MYAGHLDLTRPLLWTVDDALAPSDCAAYIERMRRAGRAAAQVLRAAGELVRPGISTDEIDAFVHEECIRLGGYPSPLNYRGFPKSVCTSVNEVICHGIPDSRVLEEGDIVNIDVTIYLDGVHGDTNATFPVGRIDEASQRHFGKPAMYMGEGGTIPFMYMLGEKFPKAQFCITGVLGPGSNAHGPNEFLHIPTARKLTLCVADVLAMHAKQ